jgi:DDE superfamily endonuclease
MNLQVIASPDGPDPVGLRCLHGAVHDLSAVRICGIVRELAADGLIVLADKGYLGGGRHILTPYRGRNKPASQKAANQAYASPGAPAERANAQLKAQRILRKLRYRPLVNWATRQSHPRLANPQNRKMKGLS